MANKKYSEDAVRSAAAKFITVPEDPEAAAEPAKRKP